VAASPGPGALPGDQLLDGAGEDGEIFVENDLTVEEEDQWLDGGDKGAKDGKEGGDQEKIKALEKRTLTDDDKAAKAKELRRKRSNPFGEVAKAIETSAEAS
jgi:hypothetical protein